MPSLVQKVLLDLVGGAVAGSQFTYDFRDEFTQELGVLTSGPKAASHEGSWTVIVNDGGMTETGGKLEIAAQSTPVWGDLYIVSEGIARTLGLAFVTTANIDTINGLILGMSSSPTLDVSIGHDNAYMFNLSYSANLAYYNGQANIAIAAPLSTDTDYDFAVICYSTGALVLIKGGVYTSWTLLWWATAGEWSPIHVGLSNHNAVASFNRAVVPIVTTPSPTLEQSAPETDTEYAGVAAGITDFAVDLASITPTPHMRVWGKYNWDVASNSGWFLGFTRNAANTDWNFEAGLITGSNISYSIQTPNVGNAHTRLRVQKIGNTHRWFTYVGNTSTARSSATSATYTAQSGVTVEYTGVGSELVVNGTFDSDVAGWTKGSSVTLTQVAGRARLQCPFAFVGMSQPISFESGKRYYVTGDYEVISNAYNVAASSSLQEITGYFTGTGSFAVVYAPTADKQNLTIFCSAASSEAYFDNLSVLRFDTLDNGSDGPTAITAWPANSSQYKVLGEV